MIYYIILKHLQNHTLKRSSTFNSTNALNSKPNTYVTINPKKGSTLHLRSRISPNLRTLSQKPVSRRRDE
ncbi:hypothetical protein AAMO2058_000788700 [Amorphochlora amoebiformis]